MIDRIGRWAGRRARHSRHRKPRRTWRRAEWIIARVQYEHTGICPHTSTEVIGKFGTELCTICECIISPSYIRIAREIEP
jgi:hypothetical protein